MSSISQIGRDNIGAIRRVEREYEGATSPDMQKVRQEYTPEDRYLPKSVGSSKSEAPDTKVLSQGWKLSVQDEKPDTSDPSWQETKVPGQWALHDSSLFSHGGNVWYMKKFRITPDMVAPGKKLQLEFKGVDYEAEVYLNNQKLGDHTGYFEPFKFDVTDKVQPGKLNVLQVKVTSEEDKGAPFLKTQVKGIFGQHDARPGGVGSKSHIGNTGGIWNDVLLRTTGMQTIENSNVTTDLTDDMNKADLKFNYLLFNHEDKEKEVEVNIRYKPQSSENPDDFRILQQKVKLKPGFNQVSVPAEEKNPELWWTWDHGKPNLYDFETAIVSGGEVSQKQNSHFGIRKLEFDPKTYLLKLNDKPVYQRGTNYIPTQWLSTYRPSDYTKDVNMMKDANLNAVRVHAHVLPQEFYDEADKKGMLVYADFPLIWGVNPGPATTKMSKEQFGKFVELYKNHPSIWLWNVHNESLPYDLPMDKNIQKVGKELDPSRYTKRNSGFLDHFYPGWYDWYGKNYTNVDLFKPKLPTEYGAQAIPKSAKEFIPQDSQWPVNEPVWKYHDFQPGETQRRIGEYKAYKNMDEFIETSQKYQYDLNRYITEYFRRNKYKPTTGVYQFMFKEAWPSITWAVTDHNRQPKMAYDGLKKSMAPVMVSIDWKKNKLKPGETFEAPLWVVNDNYDAVPGSKLDWKICKADDETKTPIISGTVDYDIPADSSQSCMNAQYRIPDDAKPGDNWVLYAELKDNTGKVINDNDVIFGVTGGKKGKPFKYEPIHPEYPPVG